MSPRILVVDDEADMAVTYERLLRRQGYRVVAAGSRQQGLSALSSERLALVISDLRLPDGDGLDVVRAARQTPTPTPVIVVTGFPSDHSRKAALAAGAAAYLQKPFAALAFTSLVDTVLARH